MSSSHLASSGRQSSDERDLLPELPSSEAIVAAGAGGAFHQHSSPYSQPHSPRAPTHPSEAEPEEVVELSRTLTGASSTHPHVPVDYFDLEGVNELRRTLTIQSAAQNRRPDAQRKDGHASDDSTVISEDKGKEEDRFDFEQVLKNIVQCGQEDGIKPRRLGVVFQDLRVQGLGAAATYQPTVLDPFNPKLLIEKFNLLRYPSVHDILSGFEGVVNPGKMLLVLGRPGAGCSTFLKALSNQHDEYYGISGLLRLNKRSTF